MRHAIKLCLSGMMQGYSESRFIYKRETKSVPTKRAIIGMIAAAEGILRDDADSLRRLEKNLFIRVENESVLSSKLVDFQTVRPIENSKLSRNAGVSAPEFLTANGEHKGALPLFCKEYITNGCFTVYVTGDEDTVLEAAEALRRPIFPLYLGRKCCPPGQPVFRELLTLD